MFSVSPAHHAPAPFVQNNPKTSAWTLNRVLLATKGRILFLPASAVRQTFGPPAADRRKAEPAHDRELALCPAPFNSISTDTRSLRPGDLFLALAGANFDGTSFAADAVRKGASGLVINRTRSQEVLNMLKEAPPATGHTPLPVVLVEDTLQALGDLAAYRRTLMPHLQVAAITGSSGKTTVKEMTAAIFSAKYRTLKTEGNFNNLIGLPLTLLRVEPYHRAAILEMGMNRPGEIARLTEIADPDIGCITNIHPAHLAGLNNIEGVARAKAELFAGMKSWGMLIVNNDDPLVRIQANRHRQEKIGFAATDAGRRHDTLVRATHIKSLGEMGMAFTLHIGDQRLRTMIRALGFHNVTNCLAAAAMAHAAGLTLAEIAAGLAEFRPFDKRAQIMKLPGIDLKIINDSYNANPVSMQAAIRTLEQLKRGHKTVALLGDMLELGHQSIPAHQSVGESIARAGIDYLAATGEFAAELIAAARAGGMPVEQTRVCTDTKEMADWVRQLIAAKVLAHGDWLLLKGSRGMRMETVLTELIKQEGKG